MAMDLGLKLSIRSMVYVAGEPIPFFWPMRAFIHHNPLHGLEKLYFDDAVKKAEKLFHARTYLSRAEYQEYLDKGELSQESLQKSVELIVNKHSASSGAVPGVDVAELLLTILTRQTDSLGSNNPFLKCDAVKQVLQGELVEGDLTVTKEALQDFMRNAFPDEQPLYESYDLLNGTDLASEIDELVIKSCLEFFDEGQSVWGMPDREEGFFTSWLKMATRNSWLSKRAKLIKRLVDKTDSAEGVVAAVMESFKIPKAAWTNYFTRELSRLHGWVGFIRWRESATNHYYARKFPGDLVDYLAIRLVLSAVMLQERTKNNETFTRETIHHAIDNNLSNAYLSYQLYSGDVTPSLAQSLEEALSSSKADVIDNYCQQYLVSKQSFDARQYANKLNELANLTNSAEALLALSAEALDKLVSSIKELEEMEGKIWLRALESHAISTLVETINLEAVKEREKRPFVQALFCIDTRSERIRRHMEAVGDYQTFGIAGFFGVPFSYMELGKGSEVHLCPILLTPKNLVLEISREEYAVDEAGVTALEKVMHELKETVLTPFVTVEAIGLLFGFDMLGKTVAPRTYNHWRRHLHHKKPSTALLIDKLSREQADSIVRAVQRAVIALAVESELGVSPDAINDNVVREMRECALGHQSDYTLIKSELGLDDKQAKELSTKLAYHYNISPAYARLQMERLGRIGFSIEEQAGFVSTALRSIGLTGNFSRFVLLVGHGSTSQNNPYESALDCGACGGNHGLVNARVLAQMANNPRVRSKLRKQGMVIADDVWFIPAFHNTTTDEMTLHDLELLPSSHWVYIDRLRSGMKSAAHLCAQERLPELQSDIENADPISSFGMVQRNAMDWSQVRPEWGLSRNVYFVIGKRDLTQDSNLQGRSFLHSYDYKADPKRRLLENILGGPLVVGQWINMEHYFSAIDNEQFGSGSKVYHNVAGRFGVMTGNLSDLRTGLPAQTVLKEGKPYHEPIRLITVIQAPYEHAIKSVEAVASVKRLVKNGWIRLMIIDPQTNHIHLYENGDWVIQPREISDQTKVS